MTTFTCPRCGLAGKATEGQVGGWESILCPNCRYCRHGDVRHSPDYQRGKVRSLATDLRIMGRGKSQAASLRAKRAYGASY